MARAEGGSVPSGVGYGEGCPLFSRLGSLGEHRELSQRRSHGRKRILAYFQGHRTLPFVLIMTKSEGDNLHYRPLLQILGDRNSGGTCSPVPCDLRPWLYKSVFNI